MITGRMDVCFCQKKLTFCRYLDDSTLVLSQGVTAGPWTGGTDPIRMPVQPRSIVIRGGVQ